MPDAPPRSNAELGLKVLRSIHDRDARHCVDILQRADGRLTYREFRRDPEDGGRWFITNDFSHRSFADEVTLLDDAKNEVGWLAAFLS
ncbi:MAG: hypothetical protein Q7T81_09650 [Pseudolabrys sp.]|nr:hypothetical protein [Pseudolabrys sp.]